MVHASHECTGLVKAKVPRVDIHSLVINAPRKIIEVTPPPWKYSYTRPQCYVHMHFKEN